MLSPNTTFSSFRLTIPNEFFLEQITNKYDMLLSQYDYPIKKFRDMFLESFQSIEFPGFGYEPMSQGVTDINNAGYAWNQIPKSSEQLLIDQKILNLRFRHTDSFMTYFFALESLFTRYQLGPNNPTKRQPFGTVILDTLDVISKQPICRVKFHKCNLIGLSPLELTYADPKREMNTFALSLSYTEFETAIEIPDLILKA